MALYMLDKKFEDFGMDLIRKDRNAKVVLIQDGVYINAESIIDEREVYYVKEDVEKRGLDNLPDKALLISYSELIDLIEEENVYNFV